MPKLKLAAASKRSCNTVKHVTVFFFLRKGGDFFLKNKTFGCAPKKGQITDGNNPMPQFTLVFNVLATVLCGNQTRSCKDSSVLQAGRCGGNSRL